MNLERVSGVMQYFASKGDAALFDDIYSAHRGPSWFEEGLRLGYTLAHIHAIAKNAEHIIRGGRSSVIRES